MITDGAKRGRTEADNEDIMLSVKSSDRPTVVRSATIYNKKHFDDDVVTKILTERRG